MAKRLEVMALIHGFSVLTDEQAEMVRELRVAREAAAKRRAARKASAPATSGFACQECGHKFRTIKAAERAAFGPNGCPKCGGADIDLSSPAVSS